MTPDYNLKFVEDDFDLESVKTETLVRKNEISKRLYAPYLIVIRIIIAVISVFITYVAYNYLDRLIELYRVNAIATYVLFEGRKYFANIVLVYKSCFDLFIYMR